MYPSSTIEPVFWGAIKTESIVGRRYELDQIQLGIFKPEANCTIFLIEGEGGMGKSRLLDEVIWRLGHPTYRKRRPMPASAPKDLDWSKLGKAIVSSLIDLRDTSLHSRIRFLQAIRASLEWSTQVIFPHFDEAYNFYQSLTEQQAEYGLIKEAAQKALSTFRKDFQVNARKHRIVLCLDTAEELAISSSDWLLKQGLLTKEDLLSHTQQWLIEQIREHHLPNTTILLAGRQQEGRFFFEQIEKMSNALPKTAVKTLYAKKFSEDEVKEYFHIISSEWKKAAEAAPRDAFVQSTADAFQLIADDQERMKVLMLYTDGQPVRLALYSDIMLEGAGIPEPLNDTWDQACERLKTCTPTEETDLLKQTRFLIEGKFMDLIFQGPELLQAQILRILARTQRGLSIEQIQFSLDTHPYTEIGDWIKNTNPSERQKIEGALQAMQRLSMVKADAKGTISLQDEIYRIYDAHLLADEQTRKKEEADRFDLYRRLRDWARYHLKNQEEFRRSYQLADEIDLQRALLRLTPAEAQTIRFTEIESSAKLQRLLIRNEITHQQLDELYYSMLLYPEDAFGDLYYNLQETLWQANDEETSVMIQAELWRVLENRALLEFTNLSEGYKGKVFRSEPAYDILYRAAQQENAVRWMKLFILRQDFTRAIKLYQEIEKAIPKMEKPGVRKSWTHTFAAGERLCWYGYAMILKSGEGIPQVLKDMEESAQKLDKLVNATTQELVFPELNERGFEGHPGEPRLRRLMARYYNNIGFGYVTLGLYRRAVHFYSKAFTYMRETEYPVQQATTRNNLARALAELGRQRARRVCLDGLNLRKKLGHEIPIAYSYNTMALVDNHLQRPDIAWQEAAIALAYFRRAGDTRGMGLSQIQLGEALRRLASRYRHEGQMPKGELERLYTEAKRALDRAIDTFTNEVKNPLREMEAFQERACVERDLLSVIDRNETPETWRQVYNQAIKDFDTSMSKARKLKLKIMELDCQVNKSLTYQRGAEWENARKLLDEVEKDPALIPINCMLKANQDPPRANIDESYIFYQLNKIYSLRARIEMEEFINRTQILNLGLADKKPKERRESIHRDQKAQTFLKKSAESFVLALGYSQLFSARAGALTTTYDFIYNFLKSFNEQEMRDFDHYQSEARQLFRTDMIVPDDLGNLGGFLHECFGLEQEGL